VPELLALVELSALSRKTTWPRSPGRISLAVQVLALSEGLLLAERDGVDTELALEVMTESPIGSPMLKARVPLILDSSGEAWFDVDLMHKDIRLPDLAPAPRPRPSTTVAARHDSLRCSSKRRRPVGLSWPLI
jgi:NAD-binding of NADP-dependent 3-hydroxyisobutyrate dehydrogenase